mmetsp:Transcript_26146/g.66377  ORF Transcript_26146/g.66377 Transcript_26146/m.66377 type:complete len:155 (-) Transcript_26146:2219-2683(-)
MFRYMTNRRIGSKRQNKTEEVHLLSCWEECEQSKKKKEKMKKTEENGTRWGFHPTEHPGGTIKEADRPTLETLFFFFFFLPKKILSQTTGEGALAFFPLFSSTFVWGPREKERDFLPFSLPQILFLEPVLSENSENHTEKKDEETSVATRKLDR